MSASDRGIPRSVRAARGLLNGIPEWAEFLWLGWRWNHSCWLKVKTTDDISLRVLFGIYLEAHGLPYGHLFDGSPIDYCISCFRRDSISLEDEPMVQCLSARG